MATETRAKALVAWLNAIDLEYDPYELPLRVIEDAYDPFLLAAACQTVYAIVTLVRMVQLLMTDWSLNQG